VRASQPQWGSRCRCRGSTRCGWGCRSSRSRAPTWRGAAGHRSSAPRASLVAARARPPPLTVPRVSMRNWGFIPRFSSRLPVSGGLLTFVATVPPGRAARTHGGRVRRTRAATWGSGLRRGVAAECAARARRGGAVGRGAFRHRAVGPRARARAVADVGGSHPPRPHTVSCHPGRGQERNVRLMTNSRKFSDNER